MGVTSKKKRNTLIALAITVVCAISVGITYAAFNAKKETTNVITIGNIGVELIDIYTRPKSVAPGEEVSKIVSAKNTGSNDAYVRINVEKTWTAEGEEISSLDNDLIEINFPNEDEWIKGEDNYYYYQKILKPGETADNLIDSFKLGLGYSYDGNEVEGNIIVKAEAIQSDNFNPHNEDGKITSWGDIEIKNSEDYAVIYSDIQSEYSDSNVYFQNDAHEFVSIPSDDLFLNFKGLMPGDDIIQDINISNKNNDTIHLYMYASETSEDKFESEELKKISDELIDECSIEVISTNKDGSTKTLYNGPLNGKGNNQDMTVINSIYLGRYEKDDESKISVKLHVPESWDKGNVEGKIDWIFTCVNSETEKQPEPPKVIKTGDNNSMMKTYVLAGICVIGLITVLSIRKKEQQ